MHTPLQSIEKREIRERKSRLFSPCSSLICFQIPHSFIRFRLISVGIRLILSSYFSGYRDCCTKRFKRRITFVSMLPSVFETEFTGHGKKGKHSYDYGSISADVDDAVQDIIKRNPKLILIAKFAVTDHNNKRDPKLDFVAIEEIEYLYVKCGVVHCFLLKVKFKGNLFSYETAVLDKGGFLQSIGLRFSPETVTSTPISTKGKAPPQLEIQTAADFAVTHHNRRKTVRLSYNRNRLLKLVDVVDHLVFDEEYYRTYALTLITQDEHPSKQLRLFNARVRKGIWDDSMESTGLLYLSEAQLHPPYVIPNWISLELLSDVKKSFTSLFELSLNSYHDMLKDELGSDVDKLPASLSEPYDHFYSDMKKKDVSDSEAQTQTPNSIPGWISSGFLYYSKSGRRFSVVTREDGTRVMYTPKLLINLMKNKYSVCRLIPQVALSLGAEGTRDKLIPYLCQNTTVVGVDAVVLLALAEQLGLLLPYVGGLDYAPVLLPALETLCRIEEPYVRDKAVESLCQIGAQMKYSDLLTSFIPLVKKLAGGDWTDRASSCGLFHIPYLSSSEKVKMEFLVLYSKFCQDHSLVVRKSAASNLGKFAATVETSCLQAKIMPMFDVLTSDGEDSVRVLAVEGCLSLMNMLEPQSFVTHILPLIINVSKDTFWRVRYLIVNQLCDIFEAVTPEPTRDMFFAFVGLLGDENEEVKIEAATQLSRFCRGFSPQLAMEHIFPCIKELLANSHERVRTALASGIMGMAEVLGTAVVEEVLQIIDSLLKDKCPAVQLNVISKLDQVSAILSPGKQVSDTNPLYNSLSTAVSELAASGDWAVRCSIIECIPLLASQWGESFYNDKLDSLCNGALDDKVDFVREAAAESSKLLAEFGVVGSATRLQEVQA